VTSYNWESIGKLFKTLNINGAFWCKMKVTIVMRSRNNVDIIDKTLKGVFKQSFQDFEMINFDNASTDGTIEKIRQFNTRIISIPEGSYIPGRVLNMAVDKCDSEIVVFLNSDCVPLNEHWLENLVKPFEDSSVGALFSRQIPGKDALPIIKVDTEKAFGDGEIHKKWEHFFSMASSAIRKNVWVNDHFDEEMLISEDMEWSYRIKRKGYKVVYAKDSMVEHYHKYSIKQLYHRHFKEGFDSVKVFTVSGSKLNLFIKVFLLPFVYCIIQDSLDLIKHFRLMDLFITPVYRLVLLWGRFRGTLKALNQKNKG
jgi:rhamnosyltransferase